MAVDPLSNFKATPFVSQYAGLPIEEFAQSAQVLQQRGMQNREQLDKLDMMAYQIQTAPIDESVKQARLKAIRDEQERIAQSGAYEMATDLVRSQAKDFATDKRLQTAQGNYAQYLKDLEESAKYNPAQQVKLQKAYKEYVESGGVGETPDEFGRFNRIASTSFYEDVDIQEKLDKLVDDWKSNKVAWAQKAKEAGYITTGSVETVTEEEVRQAATQMLMADPKIRRQLEDEAKYMLYRSTGDFSALDKSATEVLTTVKVKDPKTGKITERDVSALDYVMSNYVDPFAMRESFEKQTKDLKGDPMFTSGYASDAAKMGDVTYAPGSAVNYGYVPNYKGYVDEVAKAEQQVLSIQQQLASNVTPQQKEALQRQLAEARSNVSRLHNYKKDFLTQIPEGDRLSAVFADKLKAQGLDPSTVASAYLSSSDRQATNQTPQYKERMGEYRNATRAAYEEAYQEVYGTTAPSYSGSYSQLFKEGNKVNNNVINRKGDFKDYINNLHETATVAPGVYYFADKLVKSGGVNTLRTAIQAGNIRVYHSDEIGADEKASAMIKLIPDLQIVGATADAGQGSQIAVRVPTYTETDLKKISDSDVRKFIQDNQGKNFYVEELGANNLTTKVNFLMAEASKAAETSASLGNPAGYNYAQEFLDDSRGVANPNYFSTELEQSATSRTPADLFVPGYSSPAARIRPVINNGTTYFMLDVYDVTTGEVSEQGDQQLTKDEADAALQNLYNHYNS